MRTPPPASVYGAVAAGSALGAVVRFGAALLVLQAGVPPVPWSTLLVNVAGSFAIGALHALTGEGGLREAGPLVRPFLMAGFCGGLTTFSIFSLEVVTLALDGDGRLAALTIGLSLLLWVPAAALGYRMAKRYGR